MARSNNLENWNPMSESFHDANFNSYQHGPGANLTPFEKTPDTEHKLYVKNIPSELEETGIRQIFNTYGKTLDVMNPPNADWAYVTYGSFREAETALRKLNDKPPLYLKVKFSVKNNRGIQKQQPVQRHGIPDPEPAKNYRLPETRQGGDYISPENRPQFYRSMLQDIARSKDLVRSSDLPYVPDPRYDNDDLVYPINPDPNIYNPYPEALPYENTSNMWSRGRMKIAHDGTRFVTMGRGYTWYALPPPRQNIHQQIRAVYEQREVGLYEYGENKLAPQIGKCQNCTQPTSKFCQYCKEFYCSRRCQEKDWPRHKIECQPMPYYGDGQFSPPASSLEDLPVLEPVQGLKHRLRRPLGGVATTAAAALPNSSSTPFSGVSPKSARSEIKDEEKTPHLLENNSGKRNQEVRKTVGIGDNDRAARGAKNPIEPSRLNFSYELPKQNNGADINTAGPGQRVENKKGIHSNGISPRKNEVKKSEDRSTEQITKGVETMKVNTETAKPIRKPQFDDSAFSFRRATEVSAGTSGSTSTPKVGFVSIDQNVAKTPAASKLREAVGGNDASKQAPFKTAKDLPSASKNKAGNIVELLENEEEGCFEVHILLGGGKAAVTVCVLKVQDKYEKILSQLGPACEKIPDNPNFKPKVGDLVCGKRLDDWIRGTVVSLGPPMRLAAVDEGRVEQVTAVKPIPDEFIDLPMLGATCEITAGDLKLENMVQYFFSVTNNNPDNVSKDGVEVVIFSADNKEGEGILRPWTPTPEQKGTPYAVLKTNTEVCIASFRSHARMFVRSLDPESLEIFNRITQEVAKWSTKVNKLTKPPVIGEILVAKYVEDGNFYRAIVRQIKDKNISVSYLDFGNLDTTTIDNLRPISDQLKEYPSCIARVVLKDVPTDGPINKEVHDYLGVLAGTEKPLMCTFTGVPSKDGVVLKCAGGTSVNEKIVELLTPSWKKEEDKTTAHMLADLEVAELGSVGTSFHALVLFAYSPLMYAMAPYDLELIGHITDVMGSQMAEYCKQMKEHYIPRKDELCLAPFDGQWYRAVCLNPNQSATTSSVNFIDFGNVAEIPHTDLRLITKDFVTAKAMANICCVTGLGPVDEEGNLPPAIAKRVAELVPTNLSMMIKVLEFPGPGEYVIELPEVRDQLIKEGLLKL